MWANRVFLEYNKLKERYYLQAGRITTKDKVASRVDFLTELLEIDNVNSIKYLKESTTSEQSE